MSARKKFIIAVCGACVAVFGVFLYAIHINYFPKAKPSDVAETLKKFKVESCVQFQEKYFNVPERDYKVSIEAFAYEGGVCVDQDLRKAKDLYETFYKYNGFLVPPIRLALLYRYGPWDIRDYKRADFLMKQSAISMRAFLNVPQKEKIFKVFFAGKPVPKKLKQYMRWSEKNFKKDL